MFSFAIKCEKLEGGYRARIYYGYGEEDSGQ